MKYGVITIGREYCTGGLDIARAVAGRLGVPMYDKELITLAAKESGLSEEAIAASEKRRTGSLLYSLYTMGGELPLSDQVFVLQSQIIRGLADKGPCVIVGRCGDYVLRERADVLSVFLHAPQAWRREWAKKDGSIPPEADERTANALLEREDRRRAAYYNYYTEYRWGEAGHYDLCLNAALGQQLCAELILRAAEG
ncbi:MAG TPA: cytidylate kinase-like family protein [Candidatus Fournierella merdigallinarum]|nr:cytidylate kinase-like family protein [Candidatus Fournierella merdigallinarum]